MTLSQNSQSAAEDPRDDRESSPAPSPMPTTESTLNGIHLLKTLPALRSIGYGLLLLSFVDLLYILFPLDLTNPVWEYQVTGDLIRLVPVPMLAFMLVFYGETVARRRIERPILRALSWSTLLFGVILLLMIPLTVINTMRISNYNNDQISIQIRQQKLQLDNTRSQLEKADPSQLQNLIPIPDQKTGSLPNAPKNSEEAKAQILTNLQKARETAENQANQARKNVRQNLTKNSVKLILEALIAGCLFLYTCYVTGWARRRFADAYEEATSQGYDSPTAKKLSPSRRRRRR
jgi:hypothetical protein